MVSLSNHPGRLLDRLLLRMKCLCPVVAVLALLACGGAAATPTPTATPPGAQATPSSPAPALTLSSPAFSSGGPIPPRYTCDGQDISPALTWTEAPAGTQTFAVIMDDPDAPVGVWDHWIAFNLPASLLELTEAQPKGYPLTAGGVKGKNSWGDSGYGGPCPPSGPAHTYRFILYAVDRSLDLDAGASKKEVLDALEGHVLAESLLTGTYGR